MKEYKYNELTSLPLESGIYAIKGLHNDFHLVGQTRQARGIRGRVMSHFRKLEQQKHHNDFLQNSWNKHGEENFVCVVLEYTEENLDELEIQWIKKLKSFWDYGRGWNLTTGGKPKYSLSLSVRKKMKTKVFSPEHRKAISLALTGKKASEESKRKNSEAKAKTHILKSPSGEILHINNMARWAEKQNLMKSRLRDVSAGRLRSYKGWTSPIHYWEKKSTGKPKPITLINPDGKKVKFNNRNDAAKAIGVKALSCLSNLVLGKTKNCKGWTA